MNLLGGIHSIQALLKHQPERMIELFVCQTPHTAPDHLVQLAKQQGIGIQYVNAHKLDQLLPGVNHQGIAARCTPLKNLTEHDLLRFAQQEINPFFLILDGVQDPHNLGACLRSANAAGVTAVVIPKDRSASMTPTVRKVASGAADFVPLIAVTNLARALTQLKEAGVFLVGLAGEAEESLFRMSLKGPIGLVLGGEEKGLRRLTREHCDVLASLPMQGVVDSVNVSVAAGISLFEVVRQRLF